jgi:hypothetical protein
MGPRKTLPAKDPKELIAWLKANPNKASAGVTAVSYRLLAASFQKETGTQFALVPYRGNAPAVQDLAAGQIDLWFGAPEQLPLMRAGSIKAYAVASDARMPVALDIPTFAEMGLPALSFSEWVGLFAPKGTPMDIISKLNVAAVEALADPVVRSRLAALGLEVFPRERQTPGALGALVKVDAEKWWPIIKELGINLDGSPRVIRLRRPPYDTSMPGAGAVHHIKSRPPLVEPHVCFCQLRTLNQSGHWQRRPFDRELRGQLPWRMTGLYIVTQVVGGMVGVWAAIVRTPGLDTAARIHFCFMCLELDGAGARYAIQRSMGPARDHERSSRGGR